jgi:hypothetical protein
MNFIVDELFSLGNALKAQGKTPGIDMMSLETKGMR